MVIATLDCVSGHGFSKVGSFRFILDQTISLLIDSSTYSNAVKCKMCDLTVLSVHLDTLYEDMDYLAFLFSPKLVVMTRYHPVYKPDIITS